MQQLAWGEITAVSPVTVRLAGDTADTPVAVKNTALTLATNQKVLMAKVGNGWVVVAILGAA